MRKAAFARLVITGMLVSGCAAMSARNFDPVATWVSSGDLNTTATCLVRSYDATGKRGISIDPDIVHKVVIIEPDRVLEVQPQNFSPSTMESYFVRLTALPDGRTSMAFHAIGLLRAKMRGPTMSCISPPTVMPVAQGIES